MPTEQCVFLILYIHSIYGILYMHMGALLCLVCLTLLASFFLPSHLSFKNMYITKYGCVFLKLGESIYVAMDLIPILLGSLPLAHNAQHSLVYNYIEK